MSIGLAEPPPAAVREEGDIADQPLTEYLWSDLKARRNALSLWPEGLAELYGMDRKRYLTYESGARDLRGPHQGLVDELIAMEAFVSVETGRLLDEAPDEGVVALQAVVDQDAFNVQYPQARTRMLQNPYPVILQYVAVGRAAAELRRRGRDVEVYRGERRFDLAAARASVALGKEETAHLLGINAKSYFATERKRGVREASLNDLQGLDDFIADAVGELEVKDSNGVSVIWIPEDQETFEKEYPQARIERSSTAYPVRTLWVAAGRRAGELEAASHSVRIAVTG